MGDNFFIRADNFLRWSVYDVRHIKRRLIKKTKKDKIQAKLDRKKLLMLSWALTTSGSNDFNAF